MEDRTITIVVDGKEILCDILFTYHSVDFDKDYVVFTSREDNVTSAARYIQNDDSTGSLEEIKTEEEWEMLEDVLNDYNNQDETSCSNCQGGCEGCTSCNNEEE